MINLFDEYARIAFATDEGHKNPEKPARRLEELEQALDVGELVQRSVNNFCWQHIDIERLHNRETTPERLPHEDRRILKDRFLVTRKKFQGLYDIGVFSMAVQIDVRRSLIVVNMCIWDGERYRSPSEVLSMILPSDSPAYENPPSQ